ncbi:MAG: hypothetical protein M5U10_10740 [Candidatus Methanoperedens sp.]|uniref:S16 family serine protease n=1 Tax=Candidatus Methanoperedens nitratireducens TaxID=1392998 RepID=UPI0012FF28F4|nr:S16 family serine protease [Candidatus Methanoperedens nitroreducens]MDJ1422379.1 hypothetical protein [Candidatus Methanoperedens sp.]
MSIKEIKTKDETVSSLKDLTEKQKERISELERSNDNLQLNLSRKEELLKNETQTRQRYEEELINLAMVAKSESWVLALDDNDKGNLIPLEIIIKSGRGDLFLNVANVLFDETLQSSAQTAIKVAREVTGTSLVDKDVLIYIKAPVDTRDTTVSGGSAGSAITLAAIAAMQGKTLRDDVLITGSIREDHSIGRIGGAKEKALAAKQYGAVLFLVPTGQKSEVGEIGIEIMEVRTIEDAARYSIQSS